MDYSRVSLSAGFKYHIFNRAVGNEKLFLNNDNYDYFLEKFKKYISPIAHTYCYCLMPNHFHLLLKIKSDAILDSKILMSYMSKRSTIYISQQFANFFNSYTKSYNKAYNRRGSLFMKPFKRKEVNNEKYLRKLVHYIHFNPVKANLVYKPIEWKYSSYNALINQSQTNIKRSEVIEWFENLENFKYCHSRPPNETGVKDFF